MNLKDNIKAKRLEKGLTLEQVATQIGISKQTMQKYESGIVLNIPSDKIEKIAMILGTSPAQLMGWDVTHNEKEKSAITEDDGLTEEQREVREAIMTLEDPALQRQVLEYIEFLKSKRNL